eukprot:5242820-Amphidinium_carterae.1
MDRKTHTSPKSCAGVYGFRGVDRQGITKLEHPILETWLVVRSTETCTKCQRVACCNSSQRRDIRQLRGLARALHTLLLISSRVIVRHSKSGVRREQHAAQMVTHSIPNPKPVALSVRSLTVTLPLTPDV